MTALPKLPLENFKTVLKNTLNTIQHVNNCFVNKWWVEDKVVDLRVTKLGLV